MIITLDGERLDQHLPADTPLESVLSAVRATQPPQRLIVSVTLDGEVLSDEALCERLKQPVGSGMQVDLATGNRDQLVQDALRGLALEFGRAAEQAGALADELVSGQAQQAVTRLGAHVQLWQLCYRALTQCSGLMGMDLTQRVYEEQTIQTALDVLVEKLMTLRDALQAQDMVTLADLLRYEFEPLDRRWQGLLDDLAGQLANVSVN